MLFDEWIPLELSRVLPVRRTEDRLILKNAAHRQDGSLSCLAKIITTYGINLRIIWRPALEHAFGWEVFLARATSGGVGCFWKNRP